MGTAYGVALNDREEVNRRQAEFAAAPYGAPPQSPVLYIKPRNTFAADGTAIRLPDAVPAVEVAATLALAFDSIPGRPVSAALAIDICEPHASVYRPAIRQRCRDGFLPLGRATGWSPALADLTIATFVDDREVHRWCLGRLVRAPLPLIEEMSSFMMLADGDILLVGLPSAAPQAQVGQRVRIEAEGLPPLSITLVRDEAA